MFKRDGLNRFLVLIVALFFAFLNGCAKPPIKEVENAEKAIAEAKQKEADLYVQDIFMRAEDSLKKAKDLIADKKYGEARKAAEDAVNFAQQAIPMVEPNKEKMKAEAEKMLQDVQGSIDEVKTLTSTAIKKKAPIDRKEIQGMIGKWEVDMVNIKDQLQTGKIRQTYDQLKSMQEQIKSQKENLTVALEPGLAEKK